MGWKNLPVFFHMIKLSRGPQAHAHRTVISRKHCLVNNSCIVVKSTRGAWTMSPRFLLIVIVLRNFLVYCCQKYFPKNALCLVNASRGSIVYNGQLDSRALVFVERENHFERTVDILKSVKNSLLRLSSVKFWNL